MRAYLQSIILSLFAASVSLAGDYRPQPLQIHYTDGRTEMLQPDSLPFGPGEVIDYDLKYGFVSMGRARLEVKEQLEYRGQSCLLVTSRGKSARWVDSIYKVRDEIRSILDLENMRSLYFSKKLNEGNYRKNTKAVYYHEEGVAKYDDGGVHEFIAGSQDILSALFLIRTFPLEVGMILEIPVHDGKKNYPLAIEVQKREMVKTEGAEVMCFVLEPKLKSQGLFKSEGKMQIFISDDERRIPVLLNAKAPVGAFTSELKFYKPGSKLSFNAP
ncbi:MAG: DUF3108 domain-containing protein [bacterium]|nr:DUF3108 domain-containing protein [bacterium]